MNRLQRLYAVNESIRRHAPRPVSAAVLAQEFEVSRRTIERDIAALRLAGVPLFATRGRTGGQQTTDRPGRIVFTLSAPEVAALMVAITAAGESMPFHDAGISAVRRMLDSLPGATRIDVENLIAHIRTQPRKLNGPTTRVRRTIDEAVRRSVVVNLRYVDRNDVATTRTVEAQGLYNGTDGWYLIAWCRLREAGRVFRLDRIQGARLTTECVPARDLDELLGWVPEDVTIPMRAPAANTGPSESR